MRILDVLKAYELDQQVVIHMKSGDCYDGYMGNWDHDGEVVSIYCTTRIDKSPMTFVDIRIADISAVSRYA